VGNAQFENRVCDRGEDLELGLPSETLQADAVDLRRVLSKKVWSQIEGVGIKAEKHERTAPTQAASDRCESATDEFNQHSWLTGFDRGGGQACCQGRTSQRRQSQVLQAQDAVTPPHLKVGSEIG
jgi:hypothetical protein